MMKIGNRRGQFQFHHPKSKNTLLSIYWYHMCHCCCVTAHCTEWAKI